MPFPWFRRPVADAPVREPEKGIFSTDLRLEPVNGQSLYQTMMERNFKRSVTKGMQFSDSGEGVAMDDASGNTTIKSDSGFNWGETINDGVISWYASQGFIGFNICAILMQNWAINKACTIPARDAVRKGWDLTTTDATDLSPEVLTFIHKRDKFFKVKKHLVEYLRFGRVFGIRLAMAKFDGVGKNFYELPFNPDGIKANSYRGMVQIDPYWTGPQLDASAASDVTSPDFYEPTYWQVQTNKVHKSHIVILRGDEVPDIMKPTYQYGGLSIPQKIWERVYAAERTANEAPQLAMTKRMTAMYIDLREAMAKPADFKDRMLWWTQMRDNFGVKILGKAEKLEQFDTALGDLDEIINNQYHLVAAAAGIPITRFLGTSAKGLNATGEGDEANYHEDLESMQEHDATPFLDRHYQCLIKSDVVPKFPAMKNAELQVDWKPLDVMTSQEEADVNNKKAMTDGVLVNAGALTGQDVRDRLIADKTSGYNGIKNAAPEPPEEERATGGSDA